MNKLAAAVPETKAPLVDALAMLKDEDLQKLNALEVTAMLKRAEVYLETIRKRIMPEANKAYSSEYSEDKKQLVILGGRALVTKYSPRSDWSYPVDLIKMEAELKAKQKAAQADGTAKKTTPKVNPETSVTFAISIVEQY